MTKITLLNLCSASLSAIAAPMPRDAPVMTPLGRLAQVNDIADVVAFMVSDNARWINGQTVRVNGGIVSSTRRPQCQRRRCAELLPRIGLADLVHVSTLSDI